MKNWSILLFISIILFLGDPKERLIRMENFGRTIFWFLGFEELKFAKILEKWRLLRPKTSLKSLYTSLSQKSAILNPEYQSFYPVVAIGSLIQSTSQTFDKVTISCMYLTIWINKTKNDSHLFVQFYNPYTNATFQITITQPLCNFW